MGGNQGKVEHRESIHSPLLLLAPLPGRHEPDQTTGEITLCACVLCARCVSRKEGATGRGERVRALACALMIPPPVV